jgi:hypothetical protein
VLRAKLGTPHFVSGFRSEGRFEVQRDDHCQFRGLQLLHSAIIQKIVGDAKS